MNKPRDNVEFITERMNYSRQGALMQVFIIAGLQKYAELTCQAQPGHFDNGMVNGHAWRACAEEFLTKLAEFQGCAVEIPAPRPALEIQRMLVISTSHLPVRFHPWMDEQMQHRLDQVPARPGDQQLIVDPVGDYGWRICLAKEATEQYLTTHPANDPLSRLLCFGIEQGCDWLTLDRDGPVVVGLPGHDCLGT